MKIALVGGAPSSEKLAPFGDPSWEIWVLAIRHQYYKRFDRVFEVHDYYQNYGEEHLKRLSSLNKPLIVGKNFPEMPHAVRFPFDRANALIGEEYLTSSGAYMMAYAILSIQENGDKANEIAIYGMDMSVDDNEYFYQQPCMNAWIGLAKGMGIKVHIPKESSLFKASFVYGQTHPEKKGPFSSDDFEEIKNQHLSVIEALKQEIQERENKILAHSGAVEAYNRMSKVARAVEAGQSIKHLRDTAILKK